MVPNNTYIFIHGGEAFSVESEYQDFITSTLVEWSLQPFMAKEEQKKWKIELAKELTRAGNLVYLPNFPNPQNAHYSEWKMFFEAWIGQIVIQGDLIFIGHSLGGNFLLKYFSENPEFAHTIGSIHFVATCIETGDFCAPTNYDFLQTIGNQVHIWHAVDDSVVPFTIGQKLSVIFPKAETHFFSSEKGYGHFHGLERIPELEDIIFGSKKS